MTLKQLSIFVVIGLYACTNQNEQSNRQLLHAAVQEVNTENAFNLLSSVETNLLSERDFAVYTILRIKLKEKKGQGISEDTLVFKAKDYLIQVDDSYTDMALFVAANVHNHRGETTQAIKNYLEAANRTEDNSLNGLANHNIARLHYLQGAYKQSIKFLDKTDRYYFIANAKSVDHMRSIELRALNYLYLNKLDSALNYFNKAEELALLHNDSKDLLRIIHNISFALCEAKDYKRAKEKCNKVITLVGKDDHEILGLLQITKSHLYYHAGQNDSAYMCISKAYDLLKNTGNDMIEIYRLFSTIEEKRGNHKEALHYNQLHSSAKEAANERKTEYQKASQDNSIQKIQQERDKYQKSKSDLYIVIGFLILTLLITLLIVAFYINRERFREKFRTQKAEFYQFEKKVKTEKAVLEKELEEIQKRQVAYQKSFMDTQVELSKLKEKALKEKEEYLVFRKEAIESREKANQEKETFRRFKIATENERSELQQFINGYRKEKEKLEEDITISKKLCNEERIRLMYHISDIGKLRELTDARNVNNIEVRRQMNKIIEKMEFEGIFPILDHTFHGYLSQLRVDYSQLSESEYRLFVLACAGFKSRDIYIILNLASSHSADTKKTHLRRKLDLETRTSFQELFSWKYAVTEAIA